MSQNPVGLAKPPSEYDEEFVLASIKAFINNLEVIDNLILNYLADRKMAPYQLIKKRGKKRTTVNNSNPQLRKQVSKNSESGQLQTPKKNQLCSKHSETQSVLTRKKLNSKNASSKNNRIVGEFKPIYQLHKYNTENEWKTGTEEFQRMIYSRRSQIPNTTWKKGGKIFKLAGVV